MAYTVRGHRCVRVDLSSGKSVLLGSQRSEELAGAIAERIGQFGDCGSTGRCP